MIMLISEGVYPWKSVYFGPATREAEAQCEMDFQATAPVSQNYCRITFA